MALKGKTIKYLGIYIDEHLNWKTQITHANNKLAKNFGIINKLRHYLSLHTLKQLYYSLIHPYGLMSWGNTSKTKITQLYTYSVVASHAQSNKHEIHLSSICSMYMLYGPSLDTARIWYAVSSDWSYKIREFMASKHYPQ